MHKIIVDRQCGCIKRSGMPLERAFESKDDALLHGTDWVQQMNSKFCKKHAFTLVEDNENFRILMAMK